MPINQAWLDQIIEDVIEPELPICDPHHHFWDRLGSRYLLEELLADAGGGHRLRSTVFIECMSMFNHRASVTMAPVGETEFVQGIAAQSASGQYGETVVAAGIVGFADLLLGNDVEPVLAAHVAASPNRFRGIRHACSWDASDEIRNSHTKPPPQLYLNDQFREGFACLQTHNLLFDAWLYHTQLAELASLARAFPRQRIILDHVGGPLGKGPYANHREEVRQIWEQGIADLASCPNVVIKLGGLAMDINGFRWNKRKLPPTSEELAGATAPYINYCIQQFGPERCMFESNFPVDKVSCSYTILWNSFKRITKDYSAADKAHLFHDTAEEVYRLGEPL